MSINRPPIVTVPAFVMCDSGPSSLIDLRMPKRSSIAISGPPKRSETIDAAEPMMSARTISVLQEFYERLEFHRPRRL